MMLLVFLFVWVGSFVPLFFIPFATGGWFLMALATGLLTAFVGWSFVSMQAMSDSCMDFYRSWWAFAIVTAFGGTGLFIWSLVMLIARGSGLHVEVRNG